MPDMHPNAQKLVVFGLIALFIVSWSSFLLPHSGLPALRPERADSLQESPIYNNTLGFQKVFALALPDRADRTVPLLNAASATNITLTVLDAVRDHQIEHDSWPQDWGKDQVHQPGELGCLISHVRTWKKVIDERISTALIVESDADWDMRVKDIMTLVAEGVQTIVDWPFNPTNNTARYGAPMPPSPYGENWDIIWIGHCGSSNNGNGRYYPINDTTVPPEDREFKFGDVPQDAQHRPGTRMMYGLTGSVCSTGYAISYTGAVKLVDYFKESQENLDLRLMTLCRDKLDITCVGVYPQVITAAQSHSNIEHADGEIANYEAVEEEVVVRAGPAIQYSARINAEAARQGLGKESWVAEWNSTWAMVDDEWAQISFEEEKEMEALALLESDSGGRNGTMDGSNS